MEVGDVSQYSQVFVKDLVVGSTHRQKVFRAKIIELPYIMEGLHVIVEDLSGDCLQVSVYNMGIRNMHIADKIFQLGYELSVYDPFMKAFSNGGVGIRVENPKEVYVGPPRPDFENIDYQEEGNRSFKNQQFERAQKFYTMGLKSKQEVVKLLGNISACLQQQNQYFASLMYAYSSLRIDEFYSKGWFRISEALQKLGRTDELESTYKFAPEKVREAFNLSKTSKRKNKSYCEAMQTFFVSSLSTFVQTKASSLEGSFEELKIQGNQFFRQKSFSNALNYYLNALDLEKKQISVLLNNRAVCNLRLNENLQAAMDASASFLLQHKNNEKALFRKASALQKMGQFQLAIQSIKFENEILQNSPSLKDLLQDLEQIGEQKLSNIENIYKIKQTREDNQKNFDNKDEAWSEILQSFQKIRSSAPRHEREILDYIMYDSRVPNFYDEYVQGGHMPPHCDQQLCDEWLSKTYQESITISKKFELDRIIYDSEGDNKLQEIYKLQIAKRLGNPSSKRLQWWCEANLGDVYLASRVNSYPTEILHSFSHIWSEPIDLQLGTVHVAVGYVDLGQLLTANIFGEETDVPLQFVGYEQSAYCTAKTLVIARMLKEKVKPEIILQVWYSSGWSLETLQQFRTTVGTVIKEYELYKEVESLMRHWLAAPRVPLLESQKLWLKYHPENDFLTANVIKKEDRIELVSYLLTGRLLECQVGSVVMFANPPSYPHLSYNETITQLLKEPEVVKNYAKYDTIIGIFIGTTLERITSLSGSISNRKISIELRLQSVTPSDKKAQKEIKQLAPYTMSWSNLVDYYGARDFHTMAAACCKGEDTLHFMHTMNWVYDVKGSMSIDYPFSFQYNFYKDMQKDYKEINGDFQKVFLSPPVDNPWNICDGFLTDQFSQIWAEKFYKDGGVIPRNTSSTMQHTQTGGAVSYPFSIFSKSQGNLYMKYSYSKNVNLVRMEI